MRRMKFLQAFIIMMFALVFAGKVNIFAADVDICVVVETKDGEYQMEDSDDKTIDGLTWDGSKKVLTLNNYNGGYIKLSSISGLNKCTINVNGKNTMKTSKYDKLFSIDGINAVFIGDGTLDLIMSNYEGNLNEAHFQQVNNGSITIDGPVINMKKSTHSLDAKNIFMKSGSLNIERVPRIWDHGSEYSFYYYKSIYVGELFVVEGGSINIEYVYPKNYENVYVDFGDDYAIYMGDPRSSYIGRGTINCIVADELKNLVKLTNKKRSVSFFFEGDEKEYTNLDTIKGLSWDANNFVLTMDGYNGAGIVIKSNYIIEDIDVVVKGTNNINVRDNKGISTQNVNLNFIDTGSVKIDTKDVMKSNVFDMKATNKYGANLKIDGPTIDIVGKNNNPIYVSKFIMNSGCLNMELLYNDSQNYLAAIFAQYGIEINGGTIIVKYLGTGIVNVDPAILSDNSYFPGSVDNCIVVLIANENLLDKIKAFGCLSNNPEEDKFIVGDNVTIVKATSLDKVKIDISKFKASLSQTKYVYDGKEKKPTVGIENLVENRDFTVKYINNIKPGKATAVVTGIGMFTGEIKLDFTIDEVKSEYEPTVDSKINNSNYIYKIIKAGSKDGKVVGQVRVIGLKKKSLKKIKIANVVTIDNVKYRCVVIGKNVTTIGKQAFYNCKALKTVKINTKKLKKVGKKAFYRKGRKKLTIKVPKKLKKKYTKILKNSKINKYVIK